MAALASHIPLNNLFGVNIVLNGVAAIAGWPRGPLEVIWRIKTFPPVRAFGNGIRPPYFACHVPLRRLGKVVIANLGEVSLLPDASVHESNLLPGNLVNGFVDRSGIMASGC